MSAYYAQAIAEEVMCVRPETHLARPSVTTDRTPDGGPFPQGFLYGMAKRSQSRPPYTHQALLGPGPRRMHLVFPSPSLPSPMPSVSGGRQKHQLRPQLVQGQQLDLKNSSLPGNAREGPIPFPRPKAMGLAGTRRVQP